MGRERQMLAKQDGKGVDEMLMMKIDHGRCNWTQSMMAVLNVNPLNHQKFMAS